MSISEKIVSAGFSPTEKNKRDNKKYDITLTEESRDYTAGTDARHLKDVADSILRFAPIDLIPEQFASVHSEDERILIRNIGECVCFYKDFIPKI